MSLLFRRVGLKASDFQNAVTVTPEKDDGLGEPQVWPSTPHCADESIQDNDGKEVENSSLKGPISSRAAQDVDIGARTPETADL